MAATSPAGGAAPRLRSVDSSSGDMEMAGVPRAELKEHKDSHQTRSRAVGSLAHVAATALKRKNAVVRVAVASIVALFAAAGIAKVTRRVLFHSDVVGHCDALPSTARVAVLLAGSPRAFNRTHCSFARRVVKPLRDRGHPVDVFFSSTEPLADERFGSGTERAALQKLRSDHDVAFKIIDVAATASAAPETCAAALRERFDANDAKDSSRKERFAETTLDDDDTLKKKKRLSRTTRRRLRVENKNTRLSVRRVRRYHSRVPVVASRARRRGRVAAQAGARAFWKFWKFAARVDRGGGFSARVRGRLARARAVRGSRRTQASGALGPRARGRERPIRHGAGARDGGVRRDVPRAVSGGRGDKRAAA